MKYNEWTFSSCDSDVKHKVADIRLYSDDMEKIEIELKPVYTDSSGNGKIGIITTAFVSTRPTMKDLCYQQSTPCFL